MNAEEFSSSIITASPQQAGQLVDVVVRAFISDPPSRWVFPDEQQSLQYFPQFVRALGGNAFTQGAALATADYSGAALWPAPDAAPDEEALGKLIEDGVAIAEIKVGSCPPIVPMLRRPLMSAIGTKRTSRPTRLSEHSASVQGLGGPHAVVGSGHSPTGLP